MDLVAAASSASAWRRSVRLRRTRTVVSEREEEEEEEDVGRRRVWELEGAVEELREEKEAAEAEEALLRAELEAERGAAGTAASETMLMIERLQREKAVALVEARQYRRLAEGRAERDRVLQDELASLSALVGDYLFLLYAHGIGPDNQETETETEARVVPDADGESGTDVDKGVVVDRSPPSPVRKEPDYTAEIGSTAAAEAATKRAAAASAQDRLVIDDTAAENLHARVEALEADRAATRKEVAALRAEPAQIMLAREMTRRVCRAAAAAGTRPGAVTTPRFSVLAICKRLLSIFLRRKKSSTSRFTSGSSSTVLPGILLLLDRSMRRCRATVAAAAAAGSCCRDDHEFDHKTCSSLL